jgi:arylamine N-acetyltransferase
MRTFRDDTGRTWNIEVNDRTRRRIRMHYQIELRMTRREDYDRMGMILKTPEKLLPFLFELCREQADRRKVTLADFAAVVQTMQGVVGAFYSYLDELAATMPPEPKRMIRELIRS